MKQKHLQTKSAHLMQTYLVSPCKACNARMNTSVKHRSGLFLILGGHVMCKTCFWLQLGLWLLETLVLAGSLLVDHARGTQFPQCAANGLRFGFIHQFGPPLSLSLFLCIAAWPQTVGTKWS